MKFIVLTLLLFSYTNTVWGQNPLGLIESLDTLAELNQKRFDRLYDRLAPTPKNSVYLSAIDIVDVKIDPIYYQSLALHSDRRYFSLATKSECQFYAALENHLLKTSKGHADFVIVNLKKNSDPKIEQALVKTDDFIKKIYSIKCFQNKEIGSLFADRSLKKTLSLQRFVIPKTENECLPIFSEWPKNPFLPYLCKIPDTIKKGQMAELKLKNLDLGKESKIQAGINYQILIEKMHEYVNSIPLFQRNFLENLCGNLNDPQKFCSLYLSNDVWNRIINGEIPMAKFTPRCEAYTNKSPLKAEDLQKCANDFIGNTQICTTLDGKRYPGLFPRPDCSEISDALNVSQLNYTYVDCPGSVDNESITNIHRILNHFRPEKFESNDKNCSSNSSNSFANLNIEFKNKQAWPLEICFKDRIENDQVCKTYIPGDDTSNKYSEVSVLSKIFNRLYNTPDNAKCKIVDEAQYNPMLLEFKNGCFIVVEKRKCTTFQCDRKIILNGREINDIKYVGIPIFDYVPNSFSNEKYAVSNMMTDSLKINVSPIKNLTELKFFFSQGKNRIIHGLGCAEDLLPKRFKKSHLNQCTPMPFIVDGFKEIQTQSYLSLRTALDEIHSPQFVNWNFLYSAVVAYRELHPLNSWNLYGMRQ